MEWGPCVSWDYSSEKRIGGFGLIPPPMCCLIAPLGVFAWDEAKKERARVRPYGKTANFYWGALARVTFPVSEVKEAHRISPDFAKIDDCEGGSLFKRSPKRTLFDEKWVLTVGDKTSKREQSNHPLGRPECDPFCGGFRSDVYDGADQSRCVFGSSMQKLLKGQPCPAPVRV